MILIGKNLIENISKLKYEVPDVNVIDFYKDTKIKFNLVTVEERPSNNGIMTNNKQRLVSNNYTIEIYTKQSKINDILSTNRDVALSIAKTIDDYLSNVLGMRMEGSVSSAPYFDNTVCRLIMRYVANIDIKENLIYKNYK
ncbi:MAG: hypothetical protein RR708_04370 [Bacilli bacterium]